MELRGRQRAVVFAAIVLGMIVLGGYLMFRSTGHGTSSATGPSVGATTAPTESAPIPNQSTSSSAGTGPDIYRWLPFTQVDLGQASEIATRFAAAYQTFRYDESAPAYLASMQGVANSSLIARIGQAFSAPGVASQRRADQTIATGSGTITSLRSYDSTSLIFLMTLSQSQTGKTPGSTSANYAVTVTRNGTGWIVYDIQPAGAGNF